MTSPNHSINDIFNVIENIHILLITNYGFEVANMQTIRYIGKLIALIVGTLIGLRVLVIMINRVPGVIVGLSIIAIILFITAYIKGGWQAIGIRSKKASVIATIISVILLIVSTVI